MIVRKAELLVFMQKASSLAAADEALLDLIHPLAEGVLSAWMQQNLKYEQHVEYLPIGKPQLDNDYPLSDIDFRSETAGFIGGRAGTEFLQLKHLPVALTGLEVREDVGAYGGQVSGSFSDETILTLGTDYYLDVDDASASLSRSGILWRIGAWPAEPRSIKVTYYGGYSATQLADSTVASAVKLAALQTVSAAFWTAKNLAKSQGIGPKMSESIGKYSYSHAAEWAAARLSLAVPQEAMINLQPFRNYGRVFG
jgi:hypothetical protein